MHCFQLISLNDSMKLSQWAKDQGIAYSTALKWFHDDKLPVQATQLPTGTILINDNQNNHLHKSIKLSE